MKAETNGIATHYTLDGPPGAPVVTLSHSLATNLSMWAPQVAVLRERFRVLSYDTRGHGGTDHPAGRYTLDQLARDVLALLDGLAIARTHFVGLSMGGMTAQTAALMAPSRFASLTLCDTSSRTAPEARGTWQERIATAEGQGMEPLVEATIARWFTAPFRAGRPPIVERVRAMIRSTPPEGYVGCCHAIAPLDLTKRISAISLPTLIIVGEEDQGTPVAAAQTIQAEIRGSELVVLPHAAHLSNLEQPEAFNRALAEFLDQAGKS